jgi:glutamate dehydrogenase
MDRAVRWLLTSRRAPLDVPAEIDLARPGVARLLPHLDELFHGAEADALHTHIKQVVALGIPEALASWSTKVAYSFGLLDVVSLATATGQDLADVAGVYFALSEHFHVDALLSKISELPREDRWQTLARMALRYDLYAALTALTREVLSFVPVDADNRAVHAATPTPADRVHAWEEANAAAIARARTSMVDFDESRADLAVLSVMLRQIRTLANTAAA